MPRPKDGLGRYLNHACECASEGLAGLQFAEGLDRTLTSRAGRSKAIGHTQLLLETDSRGAAAAAATRGPRPGRLDYLRQVENSLGDASRQLHRAVRGTGSTFDYPDTSFGQSLRWTGDMIETGCATRVYYVTIGSFDTPQAASFDTHIDQLAKHKVLYSELGSGLRAFATHMRTDRTAQSSTPPHLLRLRPAGRREQDQGHGSRRCQRAVPDGRRGALGVARSSRPISARCTTEVSTRISISDASTPMCCRTG